MQKMKILASHGHPYATIDLAESVIYNLNEGLLNNLSKKEQKEIFRVAYDQLYFAANKGVSSAWFWLGNVYMDGTWVTQDPDRAIECYVKGAAKNNAYCFFELSRHYREGVIVEQSNYLAGKYLKGAAENGFVLAQHMLGIQYHEGTLFKRNDLKALAWFRESVKNGMTESYLNSAELLLYGDESQPGFRRNKLFGFINYLGAYMNGAFWLRDKIQKLKTEIEQEEGTQLPEIVYVNEKAIERAMQDFSKASKHLRKNTR